MPIATVLMHGSVRGRAMEKVKKKKKKKKTRKERVTEGAERERSKEEDNICEIS